MIQAYVALFEAGGDDEHLRIATRAADRILATRRTEAGWIRQLTITPELSRDRRIRAVPERDRVYLMAQAQMGLALLDLYRASADEKWLEHAKQVARALDAILEDGSGGGWFDSDDASTAHIAPRQKSIQTNALAARFVHDLAIYTRNDEHRERAERAVRVFATPERLRSEGSSLGELALLLDTLITGHVEVSIVGDPQDPRAQRLHTAALQAYEPRKTLHFEAPGRYPDLGEPAAFICSDHACSSPVTNPDVLATEVARFSTPGG